MMRLPILFYCLALGCNINDVDINGCTAVHWAAYHNNVFLVRFLKRLGLEMNTQDKQGYLPVGRACMNFSYNAAQLLMEETPEGLERFQHELDNTALSKSLYQAKMKAIFSNYAGYLGRTVDQAEIKKMKQLFHERKNLIWMILVLLLTFMMEYSLYSLKNHQSIQPFLINNDNMIMELIFHLCLFYLAFYFTYFIRVVPSAADPNLDQMRYMLSDDAINRAEYIQEERQNTQPPYMKGFEMSSINIEMHNRNIEKLLQQNQSSDLMYMRKNQNQVFTINDNDENSEFQRHIDVTFLHEIAALMDTNRFKAAQSIDFDRICPTCLQYKPPQTSHCQISNQCIKNYCFYSPVFDQVFTASNHLFYFLLIVIAQLVLLMGLYQIFSLVNPFRTSYFFNFYFEATHILYKKGQYVALLTWLIGTVLLMLNTVEFYIEMYGAMFDLTRQEILCAERYKYLYEPWNDDQSQIYMIRKNPIQDGVMKNFKSFIKRNLVYLQVK